MSSTEWVNLLKAIAGLVSVLVWPAVAVFVLVRFGPGLKDFFSSLSELTLKGPGVEATAKRRQVEAAAALGAASTQSPHGGESQIAQTPASPREIAEAVSLSVTPKTLRRSEDAVVLWVDDIPSNNTYPRKALETIGISFDISLNTEDALEKLEYRHYDAVISDMGRPPDYRAGYTLLDEIRKRGYTTPFIIYSSGGGLPKNRKEARDHRAQGSTDNAQELFKLVTAALTG